MHIDLRRVKLVLGVNELRKCKIDFVKYIRSKNETTFQTFFQECEASSRHAQFGCVWRHGLSQLSHNIHVDCLIKEELICLLGRQTVKITFASLLVKVYSKGRNLLPRKFFLSSRSLFQMCSKENIISLAENGANSTKCTNVSSRLNKSFITYHLNGSYNFLTM